MRRLPLLIALLVGLVACGVDPQRVPERIEVALPSPSPTTPTGDTAGPQVVLWFLRDNRLESVRRAASGSGPATALTLLSEGPTPEEVADGLTTALTPQPLAVVDGRSSDSTVTVAVSPAFTSVAGANQLRAVAQVVWTVTEFPGTEQVRFTTEGGVLEVPTDQGLTDQAVDRDDYASVAPQEATTGSFPDTPAPTGSEPPTD